MADDLRRIRVPQGHSVTTSKIIELLMEHSEVGKTITDERASSACGKDTKPGGDGYPALASAIRYVARTKGIVWARVRGANAIKCLTAAEVVDAADASRASIARRSKRTLHTLQNVRLDDIDEKERPTVLALIAQIGTISQFSSSNTTKALEARNVSRALDHASTLKMFEK